MLPRLQTSLKTARDVSRTELLSSTARQTLFLFAVDGATNVVDYLFHVFLGRSLVPGDFAVVQTINALFLIVGTAFAVFQPVVARQVAGLDHEERAAGMPWAVFRIYAVRSAIIGVALGIALFAVQGLVATWLNVPRATITLTALTMVFLLVRPVISGMLQGQERFVAFGITRSSYAVARFLLVLVFVGTLGGGAIAAVASMPLAGAIALATGLLLLGAAVWQPVSPDAMQTARGLLSEGWRLSLAAFLAYISYMSLLNLDVIFANRTLSAELSGSYATAVVFRRVLSVLPGAVLVVLYPRVAAQTAQGRLPDRTLAKALAVVVAATAALTAVYFLLGDWLVALIFGEGYAPAAQLLGWMALGMIGYGIAAVWMNLFLATRPWPYALFLAVLVAAQALLYSAFAQSPQQLTLVFTACGWLAAVVGAALYGLWLRPALRAQQTATSRT